MKFIKLFEEYTKQEIKEQTDTIYKDKNLVVLVVKTPTSSDIYGNNTHWCSVKHKSSFHDHNVTGNLFRILFKDGYKLRLTWDYENTHKVHWGQGGKVNGVSKEYTYIMCRDGNNPFLLEYKKGDYRQELADRINSLSQEVKDAIINYHKSNSVNKDSALYSIKNSIDSIEVIGLEEFDEWCYKCDIIIDGVDFGVVVRTDFYINSYIEFNDIFLDKYPLINTSKVRNYFSDILREKAIKFLKKTNNKLLIKVMKGFEENN